jgi:hypothetical protein
MPQFDRAVAVDNYCINGHPRSTNLVGNSRMLCRTCLEEQAYVKRAYRALRTKAKRKKGQGQQP